MQRSQKLRPGNTNTDSHTGNICQHQPGTDNDTRSNSDTGTYSCSNMKHQPQSQRKNRREDTETELIPETGEGNYGAGSVTVTVTISGGQIVEASYSTLDDEEYFDEAWNSIYNQVLGSQSADSLDAVSGATFSSQGIIQAFQNALNQAQN